MVQPPAPDLLAAIVDSSEDAIISKTLQGRITSWNRAAERMFGYTAAEAVGRPIAIIFPPERLPEEEHFLREIAAGRRVEGFDTERVRKDGRRVAVSATLSPVRDAEGAIVGVSTILRDLSERVRLERQAAKVAADLERILSSVGEGFASLDRELRFAFVNDAAVQMVGIPRQEVVGRTPENVFPPAVVAQLVPRLRAALGSSRVVQYEMHDRAADRWYEHRLYPTPDGVSIFFTDITGRKRAEDALRESRDVLSLAMRGGRMGAWSRNLATNEVWWSRELEDLFGVGPGGFEGTIEGFRAFIHPDDRAALEAAVETALATHDDYVVEFRFRHASGEWRWMEGRGRAVYSAAGQPTSLYGIGIDTTDRKAFEEALAAARAAAESANRAKDEFLAMLGHELRNPLSPILTALQLMKLRGDAASARERTVIERQVRHLTRLVDDLLDVSRIARGKVELKVEAVELSDVMARAIEIASPLLEERAQRLVVEVPRSGLGVDGDPARLAQVFANLLTNAAKYTARGGRIEVTAAVEEGHVVARVRDTGIGMPADVLPHIFDLFVQGRQALDRAQGGLGLGLTIVRSLVERHGGTVSAYSDGTDRGSEFVVRLPCAGAAMPVTAVTGGIAAEAKPVEGRALRILVVDDNHDAAEMLGEALAARGHRPSLAHDGPEALRAAVACRPQVAFLDIGLPVMDGYELAARLRELPGLNGLRLIALTGYGQESDRQRTAAAGFHHHLVKPVDLGTLESLLEDVRSAAVDPG